MSDREIWSKQTRDAWFYAALAASTIGVCWLFWPYADILMFAVVTG